MSSIRSVRSFATALLFVLVGAGMMTLVLPSAPAHADPLIVQTTPSDHGMPSSPPDRVTLLFDSPVDGATVLMAVTPSGGGRIELGKPIVKGISVVQRLRAEDVRGDVTVGYRLTLKNGHVVTGGFIYAVAAVGPTSAPTDPPSEIASALAEVAGRGQSTAAPQAAGLVVDGPKNWWERPWAVGAGAVGLLVVAGFVVLSPQRGSRRD
jgi:methionine-rich copper-binding protein CopC